jgi:hypothetical protein
MCSAADTVVLGGVPCTEAITALAIIISPGGGTCGKLANLRTASHD